MALRRVFPLPRVLAWTGHLRAEVVDGVVTP